MHLGAAEELPIVHADDEIGWGAGGVAVVRPVLVAVLDSGKDVGYRLVLVEYALGVAGRAGGVYQQRVVVSVG